MATSFGVSWLMLLLMSAGSPTNLPLSLPPLPPDPVLASVAPEQCIWYMSLAGLERAKADSQNQVERLLAEQDVQNLCHAVVKQIEASIAASQPNDPHGLATNGPKLVKTLLTRPMCAYVGSITPTMNGPTVRGGLVVNLGDDAAATQSALDQLFGAGLLGSGGVNDDKQSGGTAEWHAIPTPAQFPKSQWAVKDGYLVVGVGDGEAAAIWTRHTKPAPKWLDDMRGQLKIDRPSMVQYLNLQAVEGMLQMALTVVQGPEQAADSLDTFGMTNAKYFASVCGLDKTGFASRAILATDGAPKGWLSILSNKPLDVETLRTIPADATFAIAARVEPVKIGATILDLMAALVPRDQLIGQQANGMKTRDVLNRQVDMMAGPLGFHPMKDLGGSLGDTWCLYDSPQESGLFTGITLVGTVKDSQKLHQINDQLQAINAQQQGAMQIARQGNPGVNIPPDPTLADFEYRGEKVYFLDFPKSYGSPVSPAWCVTADHLAIGLYPQTIKAYLDRRAVGDVKQHQNGGASSRRSLADVPEVAAAFNGGSSPTVLTYVDTPSLFKLAYPVVQVAAQYGFAELQSHGVELNLSMLPSASAILPHLKPDVTTITSSNDGIRIDSRGSLPMQTGAIPVAAMFGLRSVQPMPQPAANANAFRNVQPIIANPPGRVFAAAPAPAKVFPPGPAGDRAHSVDNLKQIALAMMVYFDSHKRFPAAKTVDDNGKPLLSWRVLILPYIGQMDLYKQFRLDEPWDSEHNKALIQQMPDLYKAPGSKAAADFKTVYLTPRGEGTVFPGEKGTRIRDITDGTSKTIMIVEAADDKAVVWTKPDDFDVDEKDPIAGLVGLREGGFLTAFCDGSIHSLSKSIEPQTLLRLFNSHDGMVVDTGEVEQPLEAPAR